MKIFKLLSLLIIFIFCSCKPTTELPYGIINGNWIRKNSQDSTLTDHHFEFSSSANSKEGTYTHTLSIGDGSITTYIGNYIIDIDSYQITSASGLIKIEGISTTGDEENAVYKYSYLASAKEGQQKLEFISPTNDMITLIYNGG